MPACVVGTSTHSGLALSLGVLLFRRFSLLLLVVVAGPPPLLWLFCGGPVWLQLLHQLWSPLLVVFLWVVWSPHVRVARVSCGAFVEGSLPACFWSALQVSGPFRSPPPLSLSLSLCSSLIQPSSLWGLFLVGCGVCLWCPRPSSCASLSFFVRRLFVSLRFLGGWRPVVALSRLRGGVQLFCFPVAPAQSVLPALSGVLGGLPGSFLCLPPGSGSSSFHGSLWFWRGASATFHARPLFGPLAVSPYLASCLVSVASPRL